MKKFMIEEINTGISGWMDGHPCAELKIKDVAGNQCFFSAIEVESETYFFVTYERAFYILMEEYPEEMSEELKQEAWEYINDNCCVGVEACETFLNSMTEDPFIDIYRCLAFLLQADDDVIEAFKEESIGKWIGEIKMPVCDGVQ